jgi:hypothetical protein
MSHRQGMTDTKEEQKNRSDRIIQNISNGIREKLTIIYLFMYCDGFGVFYATTFQIHGTSDMSVATQLLRIPKQPNCWKPQLEMKPWGEMSSFRGANTLFERQQINGQTQTRVEAGSNTSTVSLRVVGGDEKGSLKSETVKWGRESQGTRTREDCAGKGQQYI